MILTHSAQLQVLDLEGIQIVLISLFRWKYSLFLAIDANFRLV